MRSAGLRAGLRLCFLMFCNSNKVFMSNKPFIIKSGFVEPTVPKDHEAFDAEQETKIQILQAVNGYLTVSLPLSRSTWQ
jgi:hypothetical protein